MLKKITAYLLLIAFNVSFTLATTGGVLAQTILGCDQPTQTCLDPTPCKNIDGYNVCLAGVDAGAGGYNIAEGCWVYKKTYPCMQQQSDCLTLQSTAGCSENGNSPTCAQDAGGNTLEVARYGCTDWIHTYTCQTQPATTVNGPQTCRTDFENNGLTWSQNSPSSEADFINAVVGRQVQNRVGQDLNIGNITVFQGDDDKCTIKLGGLKNCCQGNGSGGGTDQSLMQQLGMNVAYAGLQYGAGYAIQVGGPYVYDALMSDGWVKLAGYVGEWTWSNFNDPSVEYGAVLGSGPISVGLYGFGTTAGAAEGLAGSAANLLGSSVVSSSTIGIGANGALLTEDLTGSVLYFNPYSLAAAVALQVVMALLSCSQTDAQTMASVSQDLCHYVGSYCSINILGLCLETKQSYCCFAGILDKEIQEGAHDQLGIDWGGAANPNCAGLTPQQLTQIDFSMVDLSKFEAQVIGNTANFDPTAKAIMQSTVRKDVDNAVKPTR